MTYNIIGEYINYSKQCINNYFKLIFDKKYHQGLVNTFLNEYINKRYLSKDENIQLCVRKALNDTLKTIDKTNYELASNIVKTFNFIMYFDNVVDCESTKEIIEAISLFRTNVLNIKTTPKFNDALMEMVRTDLIKKKEYLDNIDDKRFEFSYFLTNLNNVYDTKVDQNIKFPDVYNSIVINRVFNSKEMSIKRSTVEYSMAALKVLKDMIAGIKYTYLINYPSGLSKNPEQFQKVFEILNHEVLKEGIVLKINFNDFLEEKEEIYKNMKEGFLFAAYLNEFEESKTNIELLKVFKYIIIKRKSNLDVVKTFKNVILID